MDASRDNREFAKLLDQAVHVYAGNPKRSFASLQDAEREICHLAREEPPIDSKSGAPRAHFVERTLISWRSGKEHRVPHKRNLAALVLVLARAIPDYCDSGWRGEALEAAGRGDLIGPVTERLTGSKSYSSTGGKLPMSPIALLDVATEIDEMLIKLIRDHVDASVEDLALNHRSLLKTELGKHELSVEHLEYALDHGLGADLLNVVPNTELEVDLEVGSDGGPAVVSYKLNDRPPLPVNPAYLLWNCTCQAPGDRAGEPSKPDPCCKIHGTAAAPLGGQEVARAFQTGVVDISLAGVTVRWRQHPALWPPSIDTLHMINDVVVDGRFSEGFDDILDIGCGTGVLGIALALNNPHRQRVKTSVAFTDWLLTPLLWTAINWTLNSPKLSGAVAKYKVGLGGQLASRTRRYGLVVCNPPYLPIPQRFHKLRMSSAVAGTDLLEAVIRQAPSIGERVYVSYSGLVEPEAHVAATSGNVELVPLLEAGHAVPFRVSHALESAGYVKWLVRHRGLGSKTRAGFHYWHDVCTYRVERAPERNAPENPPSTA